MFVDGYFSTQAWGGICETLPEEEVMELFSTLVVCNGHTKCATVSCFFFFILVTFGNGMDLIGQLEWTAGGHLVFELWIMQDDTQRL